VEVIKMESENQKDLITVDQEEIVAGLHRLGLSSGDRVMVHSSLRSFGYVQGGAATVIAALMEVLGSEGCLMMPSFNHRDVYDAGGIFDIRSTPTIDGLIPDTFWRMPDVQRSINPTHAYAAWGKDALRYTAEHHLVDTMGEESPLGLLAGDGGYCLLLGVNYKANTYHHIVETSLAVPCLTPRGEVYPMVLPDGSISEIHTWGWRESLCPINDEYRYAPRMSSIQRQTTIGAATATLYAMQDGYAIIAACLSEGLDGYPPCSACSIRPRQCQWTSQKPASGRTSDPLADFG